MQLQKVEKVNLYGKIDKVERALTPAYVDLLRKDPVAFSLMFGPIFIAGLVSYLFNINVAWLFLGVGLGFLSLLAATTFLTSERYLPASARNFYRLNRIELKLLGARVCEFNHTLYCQQEGQKLLSEGTQDPVEDEDLTNCWETSANSLQQEVDNFVARLRVAVNGDLQRMEQERNSNIKLQRRAFKKKVLRLNELEKGLTIFQDGYNETKDISPYIAANKLREQLEEER